MSEASEVGFVAQLRNQESLQYARQFLIQGIIEGRVNIAEKYNENESDEGKGEKNKDMPEQLTYGHWQKKAQSRLVVDPAGQRRRTEEAMAPANDEEATKREAYNKKITKQVEDKKRQQQLDRKAMEQLSLDMFGARKQIVSQPRYLTEALKIANADEEKRAERNNAVNDSDGVHNLTQKEESFVRVDGNLSNIRMIHGDHARGNQVIIMREKEREVHRILKRAIKNRIAKRFSMPGK